MDFDYKMVIVTRKDLSLSPGKIAAQAAHAAVDCALGTKKKNPGMNLIINLTFFMCVK